MLKTLEFKLYPTDAQSRQLSDYMRLSCRIYNLALEQRIKSYKRRKESQNYYSQSKFLTDLRSRIEWLRELPLAFSRDAIRRLDKAFKAFFRRVKKSGEKPGFPRFRSFRRYNSLEIQDSGKLRDGSLSVPKVGLIRFRAGKQDLSGKIKLSRIIRRASGWFGQVLIDDGKEHPKPKTVSSFIGVDVGLNSFATLSDGTKIAAPKFFRRSESRLRAAQRKLSRAVRGSRGWKKAKLAVQLIHERVAAQRKDFCHQQARKLVNQYDLIAFEDLQIRNMVRGRLAKSILDAAWGMFTGFLKSKAASAGSWAIPVNPRGTSQECPSCGNVVKKELSEREHRCKCGCIIDRDVAASRVILARGAGVAASSGAEIPPLLRRMRGVASGVVEAPQSLN